MTLDKRRLRLKPFYRFAPIHRAKTSVRVNRPTLHVVISTTRGHRRLDKLPSNRYIYPITAPNEGLSLEG
jgi:hypothetical protein